MAAVNLIPKTLPGSPPTPQPTATSHAPGESFSTPQLKATASQVNHRHAERRALVAEACGALAPYLASEMRPSLILSILQQMATDADALVRKAVVVNLTHLLPLLPDLEKFQPVSTCCSQSSQIVWAH